MEQMFLFVQEHPESVDKLVSSEYANGSIKGFVADMGERESTQHLSIMFLQKGM